MADMPFSRRSILTSFGLLALLLALVTALMIVSPPSPWDKADAIGYAVCQRIPSHSFEINGRPLPLCARCTGMYLGALVSLVVLLPLRRTGFPRKSLLAILAVLVLAVGFDGLNSYLNILPTPRNWYTPLNWLRLATGSGLGMSIGIVLTAAFGQVVWSNPEKQPALDLTRLLILAGTLVLIILAMLSGNPALGYTLAILSVMGVILALSLIYTALWVMLLKRDNTYPSWRSLWLMLILGLDTALAQILIFDLVRFGITGTWSGFFG